MITSQPWQWTALPPLKLHGTGTAQVESLDSYAIRIAATQGMTPVALVRQLDKWGGYPSSRTVYPRTGIVGPGYRFAERVHTLERLTGGQLLRGYLLQCGERAQASADRTCGATALVLPVLGRVQEDWRNGETLLGVFRALCLQCPWGPDDRGMPDLWRGTTLYDVTVKQILLQFMRQHFAYRAALFT